MRQLHVLWCSNVSLILVGISCFVTFVLFLLAYQHASPLRYLVSGFKNSFSKAEEALDDALNKTIDVWLLLLISMRLSFLLSIWYVLYLHENIFALGLVCKYLHAQFRKLLVINLPSRTDHRDAMSLSAAVSNLQLDWIDGVSGDDILEKALSPRDHKFISLGNKGSRRAHMNALKRQYFPNSKICLHSDNITQHRRAKPHHGSHS